MNKIESLDKNIPILVADDLATVRKIIKVSLRNLGFTNVHEADSAQNALELLDQHPMKLVISDWEFPDMSTDQLMVELGARKAKNGVPVVLVANELQKRLAERAIGVNVDSVLVKPFTSDVLKDKLESVL